MSTSLNSKFIHSTPALYYLRSYCVDLPSEFVIDEFTINNSRSYILRRIFESGANVLCMSCYIWNIDSTLDIIRDIKKIMPELRVVLGGPEASYNFSELLIKAPADFVIVGEGEETFKELAESLISGSRDYGHIRGLAYKVGDRIESNQPREPVDIGKIPFPYSLDLKEFEHRIIYYETSRGCPFNCGYCISSIDRGVRSIAFERVCSELSLFLACGVKQVKLLDRTFNFDPSRAAAIWKYLIDNDNGVTNFHFEISGEMLDEGGLSVLEHARPGLFQFEIGVQSTNTNALEAVNRHADIAKLLENVARIKRRGNIHIHLDLIAGLPYENYGSFARSFNVVYAVEPDRLQLGFLKLLKGTPLRDKAKEYGMISRDTAPYEVLYTRDISYGDLCALHDVENMVDIVYNSKKFIHTLKHILPFFDSAFDLYTVLSDYWKETGLYENESSHNNFRIYRLMYDFCSRYLSSDLACDLLKLDLLYHHNEKSPPDWMANNYTETMKKNIRNFYKSPKNIGRYFDSVCVCPEKEAVRRSRIESFRWNVAAYSLGIESELTERYNHVLFIYNSHGKGEYSVVHIDDGQQILASLE